MFSLYRTFFRYFLVDLEKPCPFWNEFGQCAMEACTVCTCDEKEVPSAWIYGVSVAERADFGWVSNQGSIFGYDGDESLGKVTVSTAEQSSYDSASNSKIDSKLIDHSYRTLSWAQRQSNSYLGYLHATEDCQADRDWTVLSEDPDKPTAGVYVNLLQNPERFTGYAGPPAQRVWRALMEENCFGSDHSCLEQRIFSRVIAGMRASISVHIARQFRFNNGTWGENLPLFWQAVGQHENRVENVYFTFLFLLRAAAKAHTLLEAYPYITGNATDDQHVRQMLQELVTNLRGARGGETRLHVPHQGHMQECSYAFDESKLFEVADESGGYFRELEAKQQLREEFKLKFRNISRVMDCVSCDKCRLWGKLQVLGFGTAIKLLLTPDSEMAAAVQRDSGASLLNRQEVIALVNTLNQFSKSVDFIAYATRLREQELSVAQAQAQTAVVAEEAAVINMHDKGVLKLPALSELTMDNESAREELSIAVGVAVTSDDMESGLLTVS
ncbi:hypothetical protein EON64_05760 [archaeon]|nr:MAG: hypothetical protein EON64_05760 [archaeon]